MDRSLPRLKHCEGQVLLIILLVISVLLVVGLSIVSRSVTDIKISQQSQEAARALWIAQAELEKAIKANASIGTTRDEGLNVEYSVVKSDISGGEFIFPEKTNANESVTLWLVPHSETTGEIVAPATPAEYQARLPRKVSLYWAETGKPALEATLIYKNAAGNFLFRRYVFDSDFTRADTQTYFTRASIIGCAPIKGKTLSFCSGKIDFPANTIPYLLRLRLLFTATPQFIGAKSEDGKDFPVQGSCFDAMAKVSESGVTRRLSECRLWQTTPPIFDYLLFSGINIE